jgi:hypothetical protein
MRWLDDPILNDLNDDGTHTMGMAAAPARTAAKIETDRFATAG